MVEGKVVRKSRQVFLRPLRQYELTEGLRASTCTRFGAKARGCGPGRRANPRQANEEHHQRRAEYTRDA